MHFKKTLTALFGVIFLCALLSIYSCNNSKDCPGFSEYLTPYIPNQSQMVFYNSDGDSLTIRTDVYSKTEPHTEKRNVLSEGGSGSKPYCRSLCTQSSSMLSSDANQINYSIEIDHELDLCSLSVSISSALPSNDYFFNSVPFTTSESLFGDTLRLTNYTPTTDPRFSEVVIVYGRGIISITDDVENCVWSR
jgi:hypothetical protein